MKVIIESEQFERTLKRMTHEIIERNEDLKKLVLIGIERKGLPIARMIRDSIFLFTQEEIMIDSVNIRAFRDDYRGLPETIDFKHDLNDKIVILVDDVLYTGRSVRAAMDAIMDFARPAKIELAVFVDRGHRELPIRADFIGKNIPTSKDETVVCDLEKHQVIIK